MSVDLGTVSAIATVVGVAGGLVSVITLAFEIRRNARATEGATVQALMSFEVQVQVETLNNAGLYSRGFKSTADMTEEEKLQFDVLVGIKITYCYSGFTQHQKRLIDDEVWEAYRASMRSWVVNPNFRASLQDQIATFPKGFQKVVQEILASTPILPAA